MPVKINEESATVRAYVVIGYESPQKETWMDDAPCTQVDPDIFFPDKGGTIDNARTICGGCDVQFECLERTMRLEKGAKNRYGFSGNMSARERSRFAKTLGEEIDELAESDGEMESVLSEEEEEYWRDLQSV